ncbi:MAG TPA: ribosome small subunit-dependent GTPase A [Chloroflexia bacterium]|nr:ribosome small subunit-dependent GTPase A [Chloroflexia bacterium]
MSNARGRPAGERKGKRAGPRTGRIVRLYSDVATVQLEDGSTVQPAIRGRLFTADPPAVGDIVRVEPVGAQYALTEVEPRKSQFARRAAGSANKRQVLIANIDQVLVVFAAALPEPHLAMLDRFLVVVETNDLAARIVVNKIDLTGIEQARAVFGMYEDVGYPVHYTSVETGEGLDELKGALAGKESVLVGPSGVGKSSLLNALYPGLDLKVGQISEAQGKGRHTTVGGLLIPLPDGAMVADTAGLREMGLWLIDPNDLPECFPEFRPHLGECRFTDCAHVAEPDCAVRRAVTEGEIHPSRYESYLKLRAEAVETWPRW